MLLKLTFRIERASRIVKVDLARLIDASIFGSSQSIDNRCLEVFRVGFDKLCKGGIETLITCGLIHRHAGNGTIQPRINFCVRYHAD